MAFIQLHEEYFKTEKWIKHYSSNHQILIVGDGDFSFSLSLANSFRSASNITATSLDSYETLTKKYKNAISNVMALVRLGASVINGVDATKMKLHPHLTLRRFDRIVYNFPHAGFYGKEDDLHVIEMHKELVRGFFHNASGMLLPGGEIHVSHKTSAPFCNWNLEELANHNSLRLSECVPFRIEDYPGYNNKRGDSERSDEPFPLGECSTFKFTLDDWYENTVSHSLASQRNLSCDHGQLYYDPGYKSVNFDSKYLATPEKNRFKEECSRIFEWYFDHVVKTTWCPDEWVDYNVHKGLTLGYHRFLTNASGRPSSDFILFLEEIHRISISRIKWLEGLLEDTRY
ncbi:uncharacterized protein At4g26485-like [Silene latifolia]|uniref:uncharacterized protein At4g26485-like n=1 Tax=Silene latifolia TaxID=37657 RepID=UPI003D77BAB3